MTFLATPISSSARPSVHGRVSSHFRPRGALASSVPLAREFTTRIFVSVALLYTYSVRVAHASLANMAIQLHVTITLLSTTMLFEPVTGVLPHSSQIANLCKVSTLGNRLLPKFLSSMRNAWCPASFLSNCRYTHQSDVASRRGPELFSMC